MSEELLQTTPFWIGRYAYYRLGSTTLNQLKKAKIVAKISKNVGDKKPDGLIVLPGGIVKAVIEYKQPKELASERQIEKAIQQELKVAKSLCKLLIVSDGTKTFWINALNGEYIKSNGKDVGLVFDAGRIVADGYSIEEKIDLENLIDQAEFSLTDDNNELLEPEILDPTPLAREVWQKYGLIQEKSQKNVYIMLLKYLYSNF